MNTNIHGNENRNVGALAGKTAVVTGSTSGIGLGIARGMAQAGASVVLNSHEDQGFGDEIAKNLSNDTASNCIFMTADMSDPDKISEFMAKAEEAFGSVDILVNNAGIQHVAAIEDFPPQKWQAIQDINLSSSFHTTHAVFGGMKKRGWGRIINIASAHGLVASPFKSAYVAAKHGLIGLTKTTALEGAEFGVTCNAICPGYVWTPLVAGQLEDQMKAHGMTRDEVINNVMLIPQPTKKFVEVEELAALAVFLSGEGARSITGSSIPVDGGWTAR